MNYKPAVMKKKMVSGDCQHMSDFLTRKGLSSPARAGDLYEKAKQHGYKEPSYFGKKLESRDYTWVSWLIILLVLIALIIFT